MKKKSASQSAFFNLRFLIGLSMGLTGVFLGPHGSWRVLRPAQQKATKSAGPNPLVPALFDCAQIHSMGLDIQENLRAGAIMIYCGEALGGEPENESNPPTLMEQLLGPLALGTADTNLITGADTPTHITQSETYSAANPDNPLEIVVAYNDSRGATTNYSGASVSTNGGNTFTRLTTGANQSPFVSTFGDPVVLYHRPTATWFTVWLDAACGGQGLGGFKSTTPTNAASWTHFPCIYSAGNQDRESGWVDNNPASPFYGRMYVSWNDFAQSQQIRSTFSSDGGTTWSAPVNVTTTFIRNVQFTGDMGGSGAVYIAGMDEMGGGLGNRANKLYRSTDGGSTWTNTYNGPTFAGPGRGASGFFACMYNSPAYWRHQGWGQPAALNGVVHYVYAARDTVSGDPGNVFYIRSTDNGVTFSAPFMLNTNVGTTIAQWQPSLSVTTGGSLMATWDDERERVGASCQPSGNPCYRMWARKSADNGATWLPDDTFSDVVTPLPLQSDTNIQATYAGDYDYGSPVLNQHLRSWTDGRVLIGGASQQDAFFDREPQSAGLSVVSTVPAVNSVVFSQPTSFTVNVTDPVQPATLQAADFTVNGIPANSVSYTPATTTITFGFGVSPVTAQGVQTMNIAAAAFLRDPDGNPVLAFSGTFRYDALQLQVTSTNPPFPGGIFNLPGPFTYDVNFNEQVLPASVQTTDLVLSGVSGTAVTGVTVLAGNTTARFTINMTAPGTLTATIAAGNITDAFGNPNAAFSQQYQVSSGGCIVQQTFAQNFDGVIVPALPAGWVVANAVGPAPLWVTSNAGLPAPVADTAPNVAYIDDPGVASDKRLESPSIFIVSTFASVSFRHNYSFETNWDGGVLEVSINGGAYADVITAGGSFVTGGYNATLNTSANPIGGRQAWNGTSGAFITSTINLPAATAGQPIKLRWRMGSDGSVSAQGWRVDTITVSDCLTGPTPTPGPTGTPTPTPPPTPTATPTPTPTATPAPTGTPCPSPVPVLSQNFEGGLGSWVAFNSSTGGTFPALVIWAAQTNPYNLTGVGGGASTEILNSASGTQFAIGNSDAGGSGVLANTTLTSPSFSTVGFSSLSISYRHYYRHLTAAAAFLEASTDGGTNWSLAKSYGATAGAAAAFVADTVDLSPYIGNANVKIRFRHTGGWLWYWAIDDVVVSTCGGAPTPTPTPPPLVSVSGTVTYCPNPALPPIPGVTMSLTGAPPAPTSVLTDASGNYTLSSLTSGSSYTVTPTKAARTPGTSGINTSDSIAIQRHFLALGTP